MSIQFTHNNTTFSVGDSIKINYKIKEKDKERTQAFDGILISISGTGENKNMLVRKAASDGIFVERIIPINSPWIDSIKKLRKPKTKIHRAKLYYLRNPTARTI